MSDFIPQKIMVVWPGIYLGWLSLGQGFENSSMNHGVSAISAVLKDAGHYPFCVDMRSFRDWAHFESTIQTLSFEVCIIGFLSVDTKTAEEAARIVKKHHSTKPIIVGGVHITFNQITEFPNADCVVWGEGDFVTLDLVNKIAHQESIPRHVIADVIKDLDSIPYVDRGLFNSEYEQNNPFLALMPRPFYTVNFSRGCNYSCSFCLESKNLLWHGQRLRSPERCVDELAICVKGAGIGSLMIHDDNFPPKRKWVEKFIETWDTCLPRIPWWCQMRANFICKNEDLIRELSRLGMTWCSIGIEGGQRMLDFYNKKVTKEQVIEACEILHENDINIFGNYILGAPGETQADVDELAEMLEKIRPVHHSASTYTAYPGSLLYDYCVENNLLVGSGIGPEDHYSMTRYPYERKIVGIDYDFVRAKQSEFSSKYAGHLREYKPKFRAQVAEQLNVKEEVAVSTNPKVSIVLLSHNRPAFLSEAINSVLQQTINDWELIIIDDFSTHPGVNEVLEQASKDPRINVFRANYDVDNVALLWNKALDIAKGKYIALLDDDNRKRPEFCEKMSAFLDAHPENDAVSCFNQILQADGSQRTDRPDIFDSPKFMSKENILKENYIDSGCMMFRKSVIDKIGWFDERLTTEDDWDFVIRIVHESGGFGIIQEPLAEYRWHSENRIYRSNELGISTTHNFILKEKSYGHRYNILLFHQQKSEITLSQNNVLRGVTNALLSLPWATTDVLPVGSQIARTDYDLVIAFMPFSIDRYQLEMARSKGKIMVPYICEDPQAITHNLVIAGMMDYIFTNDISVIPDYERAIGKGAVGYSPSISLDDIGLTFRDNVAKSHDVIFYGYAYDSRVAFVRQLLSMPSPWNITIVGGGWQNKGINGTIVNELSEQDSLALMEESKIVVLLNRKHTDLGGQEDHRKPESVVRGYFECGSGSLIMINDDRKYHNFNGEVIFYFDAKDLLNKINYYMGHNAEREAIGKKAKTRALNDFTYRIRMTKFVNSVRSLRYGYEII